MPTLPYPSYPIVTIVLNMWVNSGGEVEADVPVLREVEARADGPGGTWKEPDERLTARFLKPVALLIKQAPT